MIFSNTSFETLYLHKTWLERECELNMDFLFLDSTFCFWITKSLNARVDHSLSHSLQQLPMVDWDELQGETFQEAWSGKPEAGGL